MPGGGGQGVTGAQVMGQPICEGSRVAPPRAGVPRVLLRGGGREGEGTPSRGCTPRQGGRKRDWGGAAPATAGGMVPIDQAEGAAMGEGAPVPAPTGQELMEQLVASAQAGTSGTWPGEKPRSERSPGAKCEGRGTKQGREWGGTPSPGHSQDSGPEGGQPRSQQGPQPGQGAPGWGWGERSGKVSLQ